MTEKSLRDTARFAMVETMKLTMHSINLRRQYLKDVRFMDQVLSTKVDLEDLIFFEQDFK